MNTRSLKFQLIVWYGALLAGCFVLLGAITYLVIQQSLVGALKESQWRRARQIGQLLREDIQHGTLKRVGEDVETRYAPGLNDRFVRLSRQSGEVLYISSPPKDQSFDPAALPPPQWPAQAENARKVPLVGGRRMLITTHVVKGPEELAYLVETGASMDQVQADLRKWLGFLLTMLPVVATVALGGGWVLVRRALMPVDRIATSAERISSQNLSQRLPVTQTGDELERLSMALNRMIDRLDEAFQYSRRFVADASHELRTPLTVLRGELESLAQHRPSTSEWRDRLGSALEEVERLARIVEGLFAISRLDAGEAAAEWVKFDLGRLASATADQMSLLGEDKRIKLNCSAVKEVWVEGDRARVKQVVVNLLDNAIKYTPEGGAIALSVTANQDKALLEVSDNGIGIPPDSLPHVFERFFRVDDVRGRELGGAGLGLSIVKSICSAHRGRVQALSTPGQGSIFRVELPLVTAPYGKSNGKPSNEN
jgi:heavy metal sensor kinase